MSCENCEESAYVIDKLAKLLAEIAVIVNGPEPPLTSWSYHDLPEKVRALLQAPPAPSDAVALARMALLFAKGEALPTRAQLEEAANAVLQAPPAAVPAGYALVPVELTQPMIDAAWSILGGDEGPTDGQIYDAWAAMLAARKGGVMGRTTKPKTVRAKKAHGCHWCGQRIEPGDLYVTYRWFNDGDAGTNKMHPECDKACADAALEEGGWFEFLPGDNERPELAERVEVEP